MQWGKAVRPPHRSKEITHYATQTESNDRAINDLPFLNVASKSFPRHVLRNAVVYDNRSVENGLVDLSRQHRIT
jgi:hypothetical protein